MDTNSLSSASKYLNNLLLARGLLSNGEPIPFADPSRSSDGTASTMTRVINLVHDLVLKRDRDAEHRENLASSIRNLRAEEAQRVLDMQRVQDKNVELARNLTVAEARDRTLRAAVKKTEAHARDLKEQVLKAKSMLDQVRAKCVSDVRKRDLEIEKLKGHLTGLQRGKREASGMKVNVIHPNAQGPRRVGTAVDVSTNSTDWSLEKETNDFLAALVNETSAENVALRQVVGGTIETLKRLTDLDQSKKQETAQEDDGIESPGQYRKCRQAHVEAAGGASLTSCDVLAADMDEILAHCHTILKDPSFVPIEEVQIRDEEIIKLREGWEKMANRWKEAVTMMDAWRRRMMGGDSVTVDEMSDLGFGRSVAVLPNGQPVLGQDDTELSSVLFDTSRAEMTENLDDEHIDYADLTQPENMSSDAEESDLDIPPEPTPKLLASPARRGIRLSRPAALPTPALAEITNNRQQGDTSSSVRSADSGLGSLDGSIDMDDENHASVTHRRRSKIPRPPTLTVAEKLAVVEAQAREAEEKRQAARQQVTHKRKLPPGEGGRRKAARPSRRRSTLSPEELAALMGVR